MGPLIVAFALPLLIASPAAVRAHEAAQIDAVQSTARTVDTERAAGEPVIGEGGRRTMQNEKHSTNATATAQTCESPPPRYVLRNRAEADLLSRLDREDGEQHGDPADLTGRWIAADEPIGRLHELQHVHVTLPELRGCASGYVAAGAWKVFAAQRREPEARDLVEAHAAWRASLAPDDYNGRPCFADFLDYVFVRYGNDDDLLLAQRAPSRAKAEPVAAIGATGDRAERVAKNVAAVLKRIGALEAQGKVATSIESISAGAGLKLPEGRAALRVAVDDGHVVVEGKGPNQVYRLSSSASASAARVPPGPPSAAASARLRLGAPASAASSSSSVIEKQENESTSTTTTEPLSAARRAAEVLRRLGGVVPSKEELAKALGGTATVARQAVEQALSAGLIRREGRGRYVVAGDPPAGGKIAPSGPRLVAEEGAA